MLTVQRVRGGARKALLQRRVMQLGSLTARRDRLLEPDAMALLSRGPGDLNAGQGAIGTLAQWEGPPALRGTTSKKSATYMSRPTHEYELYDTTLLMTMSWIRPANHDSYS